MLRKSGRTLYAPKAGALPGCATPRPAVGLRFHAVSGQAQTGVRGNNRRNGARTGHKTPGIVPEDVRTAFYANRAGMRRQPHPALIKTRRSRTVTMPVTIPILPYLEGSKGKLILMRFWSKVDMRDPDECWEWQASLNQAGYGRFKIGSFTNVSAHRVSLVAHSRTDPPGMFALHSCDRPSCVNPHHLRWGTVQENSDDMKRRGRSYNGEQEGFQNGACKLTEEQFAHVIAGLQGGLNNKQIAEGLPVDHALVSRIRRGRSWAKQAAALGWVPQEKYASLTARVIRKDVS